jgi:hypothetical protein
MRRAFVKALFQGQKRVISHFEPKHWFKMGHLAALPLARERVNPTRRGDT